MIAEALIVVPNRTDVTEIPLVASATLAGTSLTILVVDHVAANVDLLRTQLEAQGHVVVSAANGVEALGVLEREKINIIISDVLMPEMDGYRLCYEVRRNERFQRDRGLYVGRRRPEVVHHRRDRHVHERRVDHEHEHRRRQEDPHQGAVLFPHLRVAAQGLAGHGTTLGMGPRSGHRPMRMTPCFIPSGRGRPRKPASRMAALFS